MAQTRARWRRGEPTATAPPGARPRLTLAQLRALKEVLAQGAEAVGCIGEVWTSKRVAAVSKRFFGVTDHRAQVSRLLRTRGYRGQQPVRRAPQRDEPVIQPGWDARWPARKTTLSSTDSPVSG